MKYSGVFFDFDYTLGDSTPAITTGFQQGFRAMGLPMPTEAQVRPTIGMTLMDAYTHLTGDSDPARREEFYHQFQITVGEEATGEFARAMVDQTALFPGARELLTALHDRGVKVAIVSTKHGRTIRKIFDHQGLLHTADLIVGGSDVTRSKPDPEGLSFALARLELTAEQVLFCGDTVIDAQTARNGGADFSAVLNGTTPAAAFDAWPHVHVAPDLNELGRWLGVL